RNMNSLANFRGLAVVEGVLASRRRAPGLAARSGTLGHFAEKSVPWKPERGGCAVIRASCPPRSGIVLRLKNDRPGRFLRLPQSTRFRHDAAAGPCHGRKRARPVGRVALIGR